MEQQRRYHEERERLMDSMTKESLHAAKPGRDQTNKDHRLRQLLDRYVECTTELKELYDDKDGLRKEEVQAIYGPNEFQEFYTRLKQLKDFHRRHPNEISVPMSVEFDEINKMKETADDNTNMVDFSDEEGYGKYLDLHDCHSKFVNLKGMDKVDYVTYLATFDHLFDVPKDRKNAAYKEYLQYLLEYLAGYIHRIKPLLDIPREMDTVLGDFELQVSDCHEVIDFKCFTIKASFLGGQRTSFLFKISLSTSVLVPPLFILTDTSFDAFHWLLKKKVFLTVVQC